MSTTALRFDPIAQLRAEWRLKLLLTVVLNPWVLAPYLWLQRNPWLGSHAVHESALDRLVPFQPEAVWVYLSINLLMPIAPLLMDDRQKLKCYGAAVGLIGAVANMTFLLWPTYCLRPPLAASSGLYAQLIRVDTPYNALPSLHAALGIFSVLCCRALLPRLRRPRPFRALLYAWVATILWSVLATKQHVIVDVLAGSLLGLSVYLLVFHRPRLSNPVVRNQREESDHEGYLSIRRTEPVVGATPDLLES